MAVVHILRRGWSRAGGWLLNEWLRHVWDKLDELNIDLMSEWVSTEENVVDCFTRGAKMREVSVDGRSRTVRVCGMRLRSWSLDMRKWPMEEMPVLTRKAGTVPPLG